MINRENEIPMRIRPDSNGGSCCQIVQAANYADADAIWCNFGLSIREEANFFYNDPRQIISCKVKINCLETEEDGESRILAVMESPDIELNGMNRYYSFDLFKSTTRFCNIEKVSLLEFYIVFKCKKVSLIDRF